MAKPKIFVSHSTIDNEFATKLVNDLKAEGADAWLDKVELGAGDFQERIDTALASCEWFVLVLTRAALASKWVQQEVRAANRLKLQGRIRDLVFLQAGPVEHRELPPLWGVYNIIDATQDYSAACDRVFVALGIASGRLPESFSSAALTKPNVLLVGPLGIGMSSLISVVLGTRWSKRGDGRSITPDCTAYENGSLCLLSTDRSRREEAKYGYAKQLLDEIQKRPFLDRVHMVWLLISPYNSQVDPVELQSLHEAYPDLPLIVVLTKCDIASESHIRAAENSIQSLNVPNIVAIVRTAADPLPILHTTPQGIEALVGVTLAHFGISPPKGERIVGNGTVDRLVTFLRTWIPRASG